MDALTLLLNSSQPDWSATPSGDALENIMVALRAPDHACLTPWLYCAQEKGLIS